MRVVPCRHLGHFCVPMSATWRKSGHPPSERSVGLGATAVAVAGGGYVTHRGPLRIGDGGPLRVLRVREGSLRVEEGSLARKGEGCGGPGWMWGERHTKWMGFLHPKVVQENRRAHGL